MIGQFDINNEVRISEIETEFLEDILTDFNENNNNILNEVQPDQKEWINSRLKNEINKIITSASAALRKRDHYLNEALSFEVSAVMTDDLVV